MSGLDPREGAFYARSVHDVARDLVGCVIRHGRTAGRVVEVESYHQEEPACHAFGGLTERTRVLFGRPGRAYVWNRAQLFGHFVSDRRDDHPVSGLAIGERHDRNVKALCADRP